MADSDSSDSDLNDPFLRGLSLQSPRKKVTKGVIMTADELIAKRNKFWEAHKKLEDDVTERPKPDNSEKEASKVVASLEALKNPLAPETIPLVHPGTEVFLKEDSQPDYKPASMVYAMYWKLKDYQITPFVKKLKSWGEKNYLCNIYNRVISKFDSCTTKDLNIVGANILMLMTTTKDAPVSESCLDLLQQLQDRWTPSLGDMLGVFITWGITVERLIPPECGNPDGFGLILDMPHFAPQDHNISQMLRYFTGIFNKGNFLIFGRASLLFRCILLTQLDVKLRTWLDMTLSQSCLSAILKQISDEDWDNHKKFLEHCRFVHFKDQHFHNQAFICSLLDLCRRCKSVGVYLAWHVVLQLTSTRPSPGTDPDHALDTNATATLALSGKQNLEEEGDFAGTDGQDEAEEMSDLQSLLDVLVARKAVIFRLDLYHRHVLLTMIRYLVTAYKVSASDTDVLMQLIDFLKFTFSVRNNTLTEAGQMVGTLLTSIDLRWRKLHAKLTLSSLNDSQSQSQSQPTPVKKR